MNKELIISSNTVAVNSKGLINLNDLHRASRSKYDKRPSQWLRTQPAKDLQQLILNQSALKHSGLVVPILEVVNGGANPGTYADERIAVAYATWISTEFFCEVIDVYIKSKNNLEYEIEDIKLNISRADAYVAPKLQMYDKFISSDTTFTATQIAHQIGAKSAQELNEFLKEKGVKRRKDGSPKSEYRHWFKLISKGKRKHYEITPVGSENIMRLWEQRLETSMSHLFNLPVVPSLREYREVISKKTIKIS